MIIIIYRGKIFYIRTIDDLCDYLEYKKGLREKK